MKLKLHFVSQPVWRELTKDDSGIQRRNLPHAACVQSCYMQLVNHIDRDRHLLSRWWLVIAVLALGLLGSDLSAIEVLFSFAGIDESDIAL